MTETIVQQEACDDSRPVGDLEPAHESARRALVAIDDRRFDAADRHIAAIDDEQDTDRIWKSIVQARLELQRGRLGEAEVLLLRAACNAFVMAGAGKEGPQHRGAMRLAALAMCRLGCVERRQDRPDEAFRTHLASLTILDQHGSLDELWAGCIELGLDSIVARRHDDTRKWFETAIRYAKQTPAEPSRKQAIAWAHLAASLTDCEQHTEAVAAARTARDLWQRHDVGAVTVAQADGRLGTALLRHGESLQDRHDHTARSVLEEAASYLGAAHDAMLAFGADHAAEAQTCRDRKDFAERLLASLI